MVFSFRETFPIPLRAASEALRIASETSLAFPNPYPTLAIVIASHNQGAEAESTTTLHDFRAAIDEHDFLTSCRPLPADTLILTFVSLIVFLRLYDS